MTLRKSAKPARNRSERRPRDVLQPPIPVSVLLRAMDACSLMTGQTGAKPNPSKQNRTRKQSRQQEAAVVELILGGAFSSDLTESQVFAIFENLLTFSSN